MQSLEATLKDRQARYGDFRDHAACSQALKRVVTNEWQARGVTIPDIVAEGLSMILHKIARIATGDPLYRDSWHDIAGYATIVEQRLPDEVPAPTPEVTHDVQRGQYDQRAFDRDADANQPGANAEPAEPCNTAGPRIRAGAPQDLSRLAHPRGCLCDWCRGLR